MTKQEKELLRQLDGAYNLKRLDEMGRLQNKLVKEIAKAQLPRQDVLMVLTILSRQVETAFISRLYSKPSPEPKEEKK